MSFGRAARMDGRRSSYSTATIGVFVALCLVGVWMMTSSTIAPGDLSSLEANKEIKQQLPETNSEQFEDNQGDLPEDAVQEGTNPNVNNITEESNPDKVRENLVDTSKEVSGDKVDKEVKYTWDDTSKGSTYGDVNGDAEDGDANKESKNSGPDDGQSQAGGGDGQNMSTKQDSPETANNMEKNGEQNSDDNSNNVQGQDMEQNSGDAVNSDENGVTANDQMQQAEKDGSTGQDGKGKDPINDQVDTNTDTNAVQSSGGSNAGSQKKDLPQNEVFLDESQLDLLNETNSQNGAWSTQAAESRNEKEVQSSSSSSKEHIFNLTWKLCNNTAGADYIPCLDNKAAIKKLRSTKHYEHRERHCPDEALTCLVTAPKRYRRPIEWPISREKIWYYNVPHTQLAVFKGHQNWVKVSGENLIFPGGGTQFKNGALHYIDQIQEALPDIAWGKRSRVILDVGCGVASFGGYLFDRDALTLSFAPKDEHEAQIQFALERGIPAISAVMGTKRLPFPGRVFDVVHCARCRVPWHTEGGKLLLELNRSLRPGGYFVWSATPVYQSLPEDVEIWKAMSALTKSMCWEMVVKTKDVLNMVGIAIYRKPFTNTCYDQRKESSPPLCQESDDPNAAWNVPLQPCMHRLPTDATERGSQWPEQWPLRLVKAPYWLNSSQIGVYGKTAPEDFKADYLHWKHVVNKSYLNGLGINWATVRNVMDMRSVYGGFAAAMRDMKVWVMNIISVDSPDTLPIIFERGLFGMYHDWCESFSTYPRSYDLLHADHLFSTIKKRCRILQVMAEVDRVLRPEGKLIVRDNSQTIREIENIAKSLHWVVRFSFLKEREGILCVQKMMWRPKEVETSIQT